MVINDVINPKCRLCLTAVNSARLESQKGRVTVVTLPVGQPQVPNSVKVTNVTVETAKIVWEEAGMYLCMLSTREKCFKNHFRRVS